MREPLGSTRHRGWCSVDAPIAVVESQRETHAEHRTVIERLSAILHLTFLV